MLNYIHHINAWHWFRNKLNWWSSHPGCWCSTLHFLVWTSPIYIITSSYCILWLVQLLYKNWLFNCIIIENKRSMHWIKRLWKYNIRIVMHIKTMQAYLLRVYVLVGDTFTALSYIICEWIGQAIWVKIETVEKQTFIIKFT